MNNPNRILVSEDTDLWQSIFAGMLASKGYQVMQARDLPSTLAALDQYFFNVVIVDLSLDPKDESRLDGIETMKAIVKKKEGTQAIVLTGKGTVRLAVDILKEFHVYHFLEKERFDEETFLPILAAATHQSYNRILSPGFFPRPETLVTDVDWNRFASILQISRDDLQTGFYSMLRACLPIHPSDGSVELVLDRERLEIHAEMWSKWLGAQVRISAGPKSGPGGQGACSQVLEEREVGKVLARVCAASSAPGALGH